MKIDLKSSPTFGEISLIRNLEENDICIVHSSLTKHGYPLIILIVDSIPTCERAIKNFVRNAVPVILFEFGMQFV